MLVLFTILCGVSALDVTQNFHFAIQPRIFRRTDDVCQLCYGEADCFVMDRARCKYNTETTAIFKGHDEKNNNMNNDMKMKVDSMLFDLMIKQSIEQNFKSCIPLISSYTNCNRENICTGCESCDCDVEGRWNCTSVHQCMPEEINIDHRVLVVVMEHLKSAPSSFRIKRSSEFGEKVRPHKISYEDISEWWYGAKVLTDKQLNESTTTETMKKQVTKATSLEPSTSTSNIIASEEATRILAFDDVLSEISLDVKNVSDLLVNDNINRNQKTNASSNTEQFLQMLAAEEGNDLVNPADETPNIVVDLLNDSSNYIMERGHLNKNDANDNTDKRTIGDSETDFNREMETMSFANLVNIMKRDVSKVTETTTVETKTIKNTTKNMTDAENSLRNNVLDPMTKVIREKNREIYQLINIKDQLLKFMQSYNFNAASQYDGRMTSGNSFFDYKHDDDSLISNNFTRRYGYGNVLILNKYMMKLKRDVTKVLRDIAGIRKYQNGKVLPNDLIILLQAIKYFMEKNKDNPKGLLNDTSLKRYKNPRRLFETNNASFNINYIKHTLIEIITLIDKDMPSSNALSPLSLRTKKCLKRVVNNNYQEDLAIFGSRVNPQYNLTIILKSIGNTWHETTANVVNSLPTDRLYNMKILYFSLSREIIKISDALVLLKFVHSRRMTGIDETVGIEIVDQINKDLDTINSEILRYIQNDNTGMRIQKLNDTKRKGSLLKKIKTLLTKSRNNFVNLLHKKQTNSNFSKNAVNNEIDEVNKQKLLEVMQRWQSDLDMSSVRNKRSIKEYRQHFMRMKNIIPQYLRGKVNPALDAKGKEIKKIIDTDSVRRENNARARVNKNNMAITTQKPKTTTRRLNKMKRRY